MKMNEEGVNTEVPERKATGMIQEVLQRLESVSVRLDGAEGGLNHSECMLVRSSVRLCISILSSLLVEQGSSFGEMKPIERRVLDMKLDSLNRRISRLEIARAVPGAGQNTDLTITVRGGSSQNQPVFSPVDPMSIGPGPGGCL